MVKVTSMKTFLVGQVGGIRAGVRGLGVMGRVGRAAVVEAMEKREFMTAVSWDGGAGTSNWSDAKNWSNDLVPGVSDDITIGTNNVEVIVTGGLTINGTLTISHVAGKQGGVSFDGTQTLGGTGKVIFSGNGHNFLHSQNGSALTIGAGITIEASTGASGVIAGETEYDTIINQGTISVVGGRIDSWNMSNYGKITATSGGTLNIDSTYLDPITLEPISAIMWSNEGTISGTDSTVSLSGEFSSKGTISVTNSTLNLQGTFGTSSMAGLVNSGSAVNLSGTLLNSTKTLALNATTGSWNLKGGTVSGGMVTSADGAKLVLTKSGGTLSALHISGDAVDASGASVSAKVFNSMVLNGTLTLGTNSGLSFYRIQDLSGDGLVLLGAGSYLWATLETVIDPIDPEIRTDTPAQLTIGSGISILAQLGVAANIGGRYSYYDAVNEITYEDRLVNNGYISADGATIHGFKVTGNTGILEAVNGGTFDLSNHVQSPGFDDGVPNVVTHVPTTTMTASSLLISYGMNVDLAWTVTPKSGTPTGKVTIYDGEAKFLVSSVNSGKSYTSLSVGEHVFEAQFFGDSTFIANRSQKVTVTVVDALTVVSTENISSPRTTPVGSVDVTFNTTVDVGSFDWTSVALSRDGGANLIGSGSGVTFTHVSGNTYRIGGLSGLTALSGAYSLSLLDGGVSDELGGVLGSGVVKTWTTQPTVKNLSAYPTPRTVPVTAPLIRLSEPANLGTFTLADITLTRNGGANLATGGSGITITSYAGDPAVYTINLPTSLVNTIGSYSLTVNGAGIATAANGMSYVGTSNTTWTIVAGVPSAPVLDAASEGKAGSGYTQFTTPTVKGTASPNSTVEIYEGATLKGSGLVAANGTYSIALSSLAVGEHVLKARSTDGIGAPTAYSANATIVVDTANPTISNMSSYPAPRTVPVGSTGIRFSSVMDLSTFTAADVTLTRNGAAVSTAGITVVPSGTDAKLYTIVIPPALNTPDGVYVLSVTGSGMKNLAGKAVTNNYSTTWTVLPRIMNMSQYSAPRVTPVTAPGIRFSNPITLGSFTYLDIILQRNGGANLATSGITIVPSGGDPNVYTILIPAALTSAAGTYVLQVVGAGITSPTGYTVSNNMSTTWVQQ